MQPQIGCHRSPQAISSLHAELLSEFNGYLKQAGLSDVSSIQRSLSTTRHLIFWLQLKGTALDSLESIDDTVLSGFRDHDCRCIARKAGGARKNHGSGLGRDTMNGAIRFVRFLEDSGRTAHPDELQMGNRILESFLGECEAQGFRPGTLHLYHVAIHHFLIWLHRSRISIRAVNADVVNRFLRHDCLCPNRVRPPNKYSLARRNAGHVRKFVNFLVQRGFIPNVLTAPEPKTEGELDTFCSWLEQHRGVCAGTIQGYRGAVMSLLPDLGTDPSRYDAALIRQVLLNRFAKASQVQAKRLALSIRMYLRFLSSTGACSPTLASSVMIPRSYQLSTLPRYIPMKDVERVIASCDTDTAVGTRDRAILLLLARLGLRAGDVCNLRFSDIDWNNAQIHVSGKSKRPATLSLPQDVGDALLQYLLTARPRVDTTKVFLRVRAPHAALAASATISRIVSRALTRAGVESPGGRGAHLLRHSIATHMLRSGVSMEVIGALLRHETRQTTTIYAKTDISMLHEVAQLWLGGAR